MTTRHTLDAIGTRIAERLKDVVGERNYQLWFGSARLHCRGDQLKLAAPNRFVADWINRHHRQTIDEAARAELGRPVALEIHVDQDLDVPRPKSKTTVQPRTNPIAPRTAPLPQLRHSLNDFVVGKSNELAFNSVCRLVDEARSEINPLFIHGGCGLGKTHLLQGLCQRFIAANPSAEWMYVTAEQFTNDYITAVRMNRLEAFRRKLRKVDLLVVDDVQFMSRKSATQSEFLHTFNAIDLRGSKLVMASDAHPTHIREFSEALVSRFVRGMVAEVGQPDAMMRAQIIRAIAQRRGMHVVDSAIDTLAERCTGSVRELEGAMTRLNAMAALLRDEAHSHQPIGHALLNQLFAPVHSSKPRRPVRFGHIVETVSRELNVPTAAILGSGRQQRVVLARSLTIHLARQMTTLSYPDIAREMGRKNHSTIVTADQRITKQLTTRQTVKPTPDSASLPIDQLIDQLRQSVVQAVNRAA